MADLLNERREGDVVYLGFNRPEKRNAYNMGLIEALNEALTRLGRDGSLRCLVLHGDDRAFCSGGDLTEVLELAEQGPEALRTSWFEPLLEMSRRLMTFPAPTVAAVRGAALAGGLEIALCCDLLVTVDTARLGDQHINHGLIPGGGATETLVRRVGAQRAKHLILSGRRISGADAAEIGLALWSTPEEKFDQELTQLVSELAGKRGEAARLVKMLIGPEHDHEGIQREQLVAARDMSGEEMLTVLRGFGRG
jgi:enoyl-CoA hydratase/carnithine racemase